MTPIAKLIVFTLGLVGAGVLASSDLAPLEGHASMAPANCCLVQEPEANDGDDAQTKPADGAAKAQTPSTQPALGAIRGKIVINAKWDLQTPDLSRVVVFLEAHPNLESDPEDLPFATVAQRNKSFVPNFSVVPRGTTVEFPNWDDFDHNVFSRSKAAPAFDLDRYPKGHSKSRVFEKVGVVQVFCNIHPQMRAMIYVTPNRYFAVADAQGDFEITGVPSGDYEIVAWHERCSEQRQSIHLSNERSVDVSLSLEDSRQQIIANDAPKERKYGVERGLGVKREKLNLPVVKELHPARTSPPK